MPNFFEKRDPWGHGMALWVVVGMVFLLPLAFWAVRGIELHNDVENWLPADDPQSQMLAWYRGQFPVENRILVSWKGSTLNDPRIKMLADKLQGKKGKDGERHNGNPYVTDVITPHDLIASMQSASQGGVDTAEGIRRLEGVLIGSGMLKVELTGDGKKRIKTVKREAVRRIKHELGIDVQVSGPLADVPEGVTLPEPDESAFENGNEIEEEYPPEYPPAAEHHFQLGWTGMKRGSVTAKKIQALLKDLRGKKSTLHPQGAPWVRTSFFFAGSPVAIFITLSEAGKAETRVAMASIRAAAKEIGIPDDELHMGGRAVAGSELNRQVKKSGWNRDYPLWQLHRRSPLLLSLVVGIVLSFVMLRSAKLATLVLIVANYTALMAVSLVPVTGGSMNMVLVVMPTLLYVLTISAAIHVTNYWKHAAYNDMRTAVVEAVRIARRPCFLAGVTTAIGLASLMTSPLLPVRDFGMYSAIGCIISLVVVLYGLPAMLQFWPARKPELKEIERDGWKRLAGVLTRFRYPVSALFLVLFAVCCYGFTWFHTETKVIRYFPENSRVVRDYNFLEDKLAGIVPIDIVVRFDATAKQNQNFLERMEVVRGIEEKLRKHPEISGVIALPDFQKVHEPLPKGTRGFALSNYLRRVNTTESRAKEKGSKARSFLKESDGEVDLKADGGRDFHVAKGDELWRITAQVAIMSDANYSDLTNTINKKVQSSLKFHAGTNHIVTGMVPVFLRTQQAVLDSLIRSFALAFVMIALVMMLVLRNPFSGLLTMLPNLLPVGVVFGLISWGGMAVDMGTMITASVALGIAVDGTLHLLTWFQNGIRDGLSRTAAIEKSLMHCGPAMFQTSAAVGIGLLMLAPAELLLIQRFGILMASLIGAALIADVIFLPALLAGPLGFLIERTIHGSLSDDTPSREGETDVHGDNEPEPPEPDGPSPSTDVVVPHLLKMKGKIIRID